MSGTKRYYGVFIVILVFGLMLPQKTLAQTDTTGTAAKRDSIINYLTPLEYAFMMHEETKFMLRVPVIGVGAEVEVLPFFTLMGQAELIVLNLNSYFKLSLTGETRWYYGSKKKGVRNMSGNYFGAGYQYQNYLNYPIDNINENKYYVKWGVQRRFLGSGLIDLGIQVGYKNYEYFKMMRIENDWIRIPTLEERFYLQTTGEIGLGFVFNDEKVLDRDKLCPAIKCFEKETFLLKFNTLNLLDAEFSNGNSRSTIEINPQFAVEQKLSGSPFSLGADFKLRKVFFKNSGDNSFKTNYNFIYARGYARYYYNLKSRMLKGKSGNGFSANYISAGIFQEYETSKGSRPQQYTNALTLTTGIQRTFSEHLYFDLEIGGAIDFRYGTPDPFVFGDVQVGIKF